MSPLTLRPSRQASHPIKVSFEFFPRRRPRWKPPCGRPSNGWRHCSRNSSRSRTGPAAPPASARTRRSRASVRETSLSPAAHLTCVAATKEEVDDVVASYWEAGVRHVVALRGDPVGGLGTAYAPHPQGYRQTCDLVAGIKAVGDFEVSVSAYPEKHPEAASLDADIDELQAKVDCGADRAITQFFFDNDHYFRYLDRVRARGINIPIVPGIVPVQNFKQTANFAAKTGASDSCMAGGPFRGSR